MRLTLLLILLALPTVGHACINDSQSEKTERQFRSSYGEEAAPPPELQYEESVPSSIAIYMLTALGVACMGLGCVATLRSSR